MKQYLRAWRSRLLFETGDWPARPMTPRWWQATARGGRESDPGDGGAGRIRRHREDPGWAEMLSRRGPRHRHGELQRVEPVACARAEAAWLDGDRERTGAEAAAAYTMALKNPMTWRRAELSLWMWRAGSWTRRRSTPRHRSPSRCAATGAPRPPRGTGRLSRRASVRARRRRRRGRAASGAGGLRATWLQRRRRDGAPSPSRNGRPNVPRGARPRTRAHPAGLTGRQQEILKLLCEGLRNAEIAERLYLSEKTVDHHVSAVLEKLGAKTRTEAAARARALGLA